MSIWKSVSEHFSRYADIVLIDGKPSRTCPSCGIKLIYDTFKGYEFATLSDAVCRACAPRTYDVPRDLVRNCPSCGKCVAYKTAQTWKQAEQARRRCKRCADEATRRTTRSAKWRKSRSEHYRSECAKEGSPVRRAYDLMQDAVALIGGVSSPEKKLAEKLRSYGFESGRVGRWRCDVVDHDRKIVVELHGDWWHVKPGSKYEELIKNSYAGVHPRSKLSLEEIWNRDMRKKEAIEALGYEYVIVWESELLARSIEEIVEELFAHPK